MTPLSIIPPFDVTRPFVLRPEPLQKYVLLWMLMWESLRFDKAAKIAKIPKLTVTRTDNILYVLKFDELVKSRHSGACLRATHR